MRNTGKWLGAALFSGTLVAGMALAAEPPAPTSPVVRLVADEWCPISCDDETGKSGYAIDIAREAFAAAGYRVDYSLLPWTRAVSETRKGNVDGVVGILVDNAPDFIYPKENIGINANVFLTRAASHWQYTGVASLDKVIIAVANEYSFGEPLDSYIRTYRDDPRRVQVLFSQEPAMQGITMLQMGRVDAYLDDPMVVNWTLAQSPTPIKLELREAGQVSAIPLFIAFSPANQQAAKLAAIVDDGIRALRANGRLAAILSKYRLSDWQGKHP